jgi:UDP-2,3-diacylglucosamine pyrophosphatase LpxH
MEQKTIERIQKVREHFFSTSLSNKDFHNNFHELYGYKQPNGLRKFMIEHGILTSTRSELAINQELPPTIVDYNIDLLDNFGIEQSIGKEYLPTRLPDNLKKIGILSDIHFPYHDLQALTCAIKYLREQEIDCLYLNGDIQDFYSISRHEKDPDMRDFKREVDMNREFLQKLRDIFRNIPIYYKLGNHENRFARSLQVQAEEFAQLHDLQFDIFFRLDKLNITLVDEWQGMQMGDLLVLHGHELYGGGGVNPSQNLFNKTLCNTLMGHVHRTSSTQKKTGFKEFINTYTTGCLTILSPKYMPFSMHNHGFAIVTIDKGKSSVNNIQIRDGKIV